MACPSLVIDGGGTKTVATFFDEHGARCEEWRTGPCHLTNDLSGAIDTLVTLVNTALNDNPGIEPTKTIVLMGLAGACNPISQQAVHTAFQRCPFFHLELTSDGRTSLYGANAGQPVVAVALGTGSIAMRLDRRGQERMFGGWGFRIGDEGGGAAMGKAAVRLALWELDCQPAHYQALTAQICAQIGWHKEQVLLWLAQATAQQYASFVPMVLQLAAQHCPLAIKVLKKHAKDVASLIRQARGNSGLPVVLQGGLAEPTARYLPAALRKFLQPSLGDAITGGYLLAQHAVTQLNHANNPDRAA